MLLKGFWSCPGGRMAFCGLQCAWIEAWNLGPFYYEENGMKQMAKYDSDQT